MKPLTPQRYELVRSIFVQVCDLAPLERSAILDEKCADDPDLRSEIESLLKEELSDELLRESRLNLGPALLDEEPWQVALPCSIGRFQLTRVIGQGGMGTVFEATQENPQRIVAVKVIRPGLLSTSMLRRFAHEAHLLARLQHPGIAQIFEAGTAQSIAGEQQPYFAMEFIRGKPLLEYVHARALSTNARLELLARIAHAVHHAHTKGVIHRDLKPNNILVVDADGADSIGQPKILDFGVARAVDSDVHSITLNTNIGQLVGTLPYMSPEQASGDSTQVDTRSDVYALGVIGFEVLSGELPYSFNRNRPYEALQQIREQAPTKLSAIQRDLRGDVETIMAKALDKDKERRYQSAADFAADIRRFLDDEPIVARPASAAYQLKKFAQRNKAIVAAIAGVILALTAGVAATAYWLAEAIDQRNVARQAESLAANRLTDANEARSAAEREAAKSKTVKEILLQMLSSADPAVSGGQNLTARELLDNAASDLRARRIHDAQIRADLFSAIGQAYHSIGYPEQALDFSREAFQACREAFGDDNPQTALAMSDLGVALSRAGQPSAALEMLQAALKSLRNSLGDRSSEAIGAMCNLASLKRRSRQLVEARQLSHEAYDLAVKALGPDHEETIRARRVMAEILDESGNHAEAAKHLQAVHQSLSSSIGPSHPDTLSVAYSVAEALRNAGEIENAKNLLESTLTMQREVLGDVHRNTLSTMSSLAELQEAAGNSEVAERHWRDIVNLTTERFGAFDQRVMTASENLAGFLLRSEQMEEAEASFRQVLTARQTLLGESNAETIKAMINLCGVLSEQGDIDEALPMALEIEKVSEKHLGADHRYTLIALTAAGRMALEAGRPSEAVHAFRKLCDVRLRLVGPIHRDSILSAMFLARSLRMDGAVEEAANVLPAIVSDLGTASMPDGEKHIVRHEHVQCLLGARQFDDAEQLLLGWLEHARASATEAERVKDWLELLAELYDSWGFPEKAEIYRSQLQVEGASLVTE